MQILISYGTRPEYIKLLPLLKKLKGVIPYKLLWSGQHQDIVDSTEVDYKLTIQKGPNRLDSIVSSIMGLEHAFEHITHVMVQGDTTSALTVALAAFHREIPVIHIEAGLRTYDMKNPYPEEFNRQAISRMASIHFCPTETSKANLLRENTQGDIFVVGNTVLDNLLEIKTSYTDVVLVTLHRRENHAIMDKWFRAISRIAKTWPSLAFVMPLHPNPAVQKHKGLLKGIDVRPPMEYAELLKLLAKTKFAISDSGGIQEEGAFFNKKVIVCRKTTERPESLGVHTHLCPKPNNLSSIVANIIVNYEVRTACPFGDGHASEKIMNILNHYK